MLLHFSGTDMEMIFFSFLLSCCIIQAHFLSINYTILRTNLAWNYDTSPVYPVVVNRFTVLANENFSLSFRSVKKSKEKYELGIFMIVDNAEPQKIWSAGQIVSEKSRLELDSRSGRIILRDGDSRKEVWSAGHNVSSWKLKSDGNLILYDANQTMVWNSMDYSTDVVLVGQNFTKLSAENATAMFQDGSLIVNASSTLRLCQIRIGGIKAQLTSGGYPGVVYLSSLNSSDLPTGNHIEISGRESVTYSFIRLYQDASFMLYGLQNGNWVRDHVCCFKNSSLIEHSNCTGQPWRRAWAACVLIGVVLFMFFLQFLWIFTNTYRLRSILLAIIICSIAATSIVLCRLISLLHYVYLYPYYMYDSFQELQISVLIRSTFAIDLIILQASIIFLLATSPNITLLLQHMLTIACSLIRIVPGLLFTELSTPSFRVVEYSELLSFCIYPWPVVNTIFLLVRRLPGRRHCNRKARILLLVFLNIFVAPCCAAAVGLTCYRFIYDIHIGFSVIILNLLSFIFILVSAWTFYAHYNQSIPATMQSFNLSIQVTIKRILLWLLLGRRQRSEPSDITMSLSSFSYPELEVVTNNFSKMVGKGGFGGVYEGTLLDGRRVAVKKLESNSQGLQEFKSEIETLGKIHHVHLVELLGFCAEGPHKLLVYEFMPNGSLDKWIFSDDHVLDWRNRMRVLLGMAKGLAYLHEECEPKILHLDVKPQNILLDDSFNARVSDFGLCKLMHGDQTSILLTRMMGTFGYLPPEWVNGTVSEKHDVYSFGIVMLETLSGRKSNATIALDEDCPQFLEWVMKSMENGTLIHHRLPMHEGYNEEQRKGVIEIALLCIDEDANMRPSMKRVVKLLEGVDNAST